MMVRGKTPIFSEGLMKHINILPGYSVRFINIVTDGTYSYHWTLKDKYSAKRIRHLIRTMYV